MTIARREPAHRIVVGIDGSMSSEAALNCALRQADLTGSSLEAITTWEWPATAGMGMAAPSGFDPEGDAKKILDDAFASAVPGQATCTSSRRSWTDQPE